MTGSATSLSPAGDAPPGPAPARPHPRIATGPTVAGLDPEALLADHGSPLYVYDARVIRERTALLRAALPARVDLAFAVKANPSPLVLGVLAAAGLGADVASGGELRAVLRAGFAPERVVFTGPGKTEAEIEAGLRAAIGALTIESLDEVEALLELREAASPGQGLMLRLATEGDAERTPIIGGDASAKFGLTDAEADAALGRLQHAAALAPTGSFVVRGFHSFGASNVLEAADLATGVRRLAERAEAIAIGHGLTVSQLDAGGGLGIPYADHEPALDITELGARLDAEIATWSDRPLLRDARLLLEPGRWFTGPAGLYLCRVVRTKERAGRVIAVSDGGIHHLIRPRLVGQDHRVVAVGQAAARANHRRTDVVGPLCTGLDILASGVALPELHRGDLLAVCDAGAYGYSEAMPFFLSHPIPAEVVVDEGHVQVSRSRIEPD